MIKCAIIAILCVLSVSLASVAQERLPLHNEDSVILNSFFENIQNNIVNDRIQSIAVYFSHQVYMSLRGTEGGYYSANQGAIILQNFFDSHRVVNFKLSTVNAAMGLPYATGAGTFIYRGKRESLQVYIGLTMGYRGWVISQFNVY